MINIARAFDYLVVAEGVETKEQAVLLQKLGVHFSQGFYFSRPIIEKDVIQFIQKPCTRLTDTATPVMSD